MPDASRSVGVAQGLLGERAAQFIADTQADYEQVRQRHAGRKQQVLWPLSARQQDAHRLGRLPAARARFGRRVVRNIDLAELLPFIDWTPFFQTWDLAGKYPAILQDEVVGAEAQRVLADAQAMLKKIVDGRWLTANAVVGFWPANSVQDDDIALYADEARREVLLTWHGLRQQTEKQEDAEGRLRPSRCLADFIAPREAGQNAPESGAACARHERAAAPKHAEAAPVAADYIGAFACTAGLGVDAKEAEFLGQHDDYSAIMLKALADRLAEACAEWLHRRVRTDWWGYAAGEQLGNDELIAEQYQGIRPAPGYPACPDHRVKKPLFELLGAHDIGMHLSEHYAMLPAASVSGFYFSHPEARYFNVGKIAPDQALDMAERSGVEPDEVERALAPNLGL